MLISKGFSNQVTQEGRYLEVIFVILNDTK